MSMSYLTISKVSWSPHLFIWGMLISSMKRVINLFPGGAKSLPTLKSHSTSTLVWKLLGEVADDIFIRLKSMISCLNVSLYISTEDVLAVPEPPIKRIALLQRVLLGWLRIKSISNLALNESTVGIST